MNCPKCSAEDLYRCEVDIGVGIQYGPYGCHECGWSEYKEYDRSQGTSPAQKRHLNYYVDQWGCMQKIEAIANNLTRFGIDKEFTKDLFTDKGKE